MATEDDTPPVTPATCWSELQDLPWWAGVLLTAADLLNRPQLSLTVWLLVIARALSRAVGRSRRRPCGDRRRD